ncbi:hypothetical protein ACQPWY_27500 [Pseudonocardia xinjiangensis]|uniref:hypothetical protein n=1 Tax=Pseudonocardia xinjiangensis TaxID=75289 RepID=UPI003D9477F5
MEYDEAGYVVVGGGSAGSVVAALLSGDPAGTVVLVEDGAVTGPGTMGVPSA